jgi:putative transposase
MVIMDQSTRRIIGFAAHGGTVDGAMLCRMFNKIISAANSNPRYLSSDHDPLFTYHQWRANLRILEVTEVKTVPYVPLSHPFIERLIGTVRREFLDHVPFWGSNDLERKLVRFRDYYNEQRCHRALQGSAPLLAIDNAQTQYAKLDDYSWQSHCKGLYLIPIAA